MQYESQTINYQSVHPGTEATLISFYDSFDDLFSAVMSPKTILGVDGEPVGTEPVVRRVFVTDTNVAAIPVVAAFLASIDRTRHAVVVLESGEKYKDFTSVLTIVKAALEAGMQRNCCFTGIGGGVITDMTAFAASIFKRGAKLELIPTTLLAMVDASIGGKTGCDFDGYKNMTGTFYPARTLYMASPFLQSLPESEFRSGLAEAAKTGMLYAPKLFQIMKDQSSKVLSRDEETMMQIIMRCALAKAHIVQQDLMETGIRMQLNLGHTYAHALESVAGLGNVTHGEAVAWGLGRQAELSLTSGLCNEQYVKDIMNILALYGWATEARHPAVTGCSDAEFADAIIAAMRQDKKNDSNMIRHILQKELNCTVIQEVEDSVIRSTLISSTAGDADK